jgi:hypothetical protein
MTACTQNAILIDATCIKVYNVEYDWITLPLSLSHGISGGGGAVGGSVEGCEYK